MLFRHLFAALQRQRSQPTLTRRPRRGSSRRQPASRRPVVESLEDRSLLAAVFTVGDAEIVEGDDGTQQVAVVVSLSEPHGNRVTVNYRTEVGTASSSDDYSALSGKLTFAKNQLSKTILVPVHGDGDLESDETFFVRLTNAKGAKIADGTAAVTILDDEPRLSITDVSESEGNVGAKSFNFLVSLSSAYNKEVTVDYATVEGTATADTDYAPASGTLTFGPDDTSHTITVEVIGDRTHEFTETFSVALSNSNAIITKSSGLATIYDDEPRISISDAWITYESSFTFYVSLSAPYDEVVTVDFATVDDTAIAGVNYVYTSGTLTFNPGEATTQWITVQVLDPETYDKYFAIQLSNASANAVLANETATGYWYYDYGYYDYGWYDYGYYGWY